MSAQSLSTTDDRLLGGRVLFRQPAEGYRAAIDPVLLAAALPLKDDQKILELGAGAGAAFLCALARCPQIHVSALERDPGLATLARHNAEANSWGDQVAVIFGDLGNAPQGPFDQVFFNPPYLEGRRAQSSGQPSRDSANIEGDTDLRDWIRAGLTALKPKGRLTLIQRADRLGDILAILSQGAGEVVVFPIWPKPGRSAKRVIVTARKGARAPLTLASGLILHRDDGGYTAEARAILEAASPIAIAAP